MERKIRNFMLMFAVIAAPLLCSAQSHTYLDALQAYQIGEIAQAHSLFINEIKANPDNDAAHFYLAMIYSASENTHAKAEEEFKKAIKIDPDNYWYKYSLALFYAETDRIELTTVLLEELIEDFPKKSELYFTAINAYLNQSDITKALATLEKIEGKIGKSEMICLTKIDLMSKLEDYSDKDIYDYLEDYYKDCQSPRMATMLGDRYASLYNDSLALFYYNQAIDLDQGYAPAYYGRAHLYQALRQYDRYFEDMSFFLKDPAISPRLKSDYLNKLTESSQFVLAFPDETQQMVLDAYTTHPKDEEVTTMAGVFFYRMDQPHYAIELMKQNYENHPESIGAAAQYLMLLYYQEMWDELIPECDQIIENFGYNFDIVQLRGIAYSLKKDYDSAIRDFQLIASSSPRDSAVIVFANSMLGDLYYQKGDSKRAFRHYKKALKTAPNHAPALNNYAYYLATEGKKLKKARAMSEITIKQEPDNPTYLDTYAWILHLLGQNIEAKAVFKHAMLYGGKESAVILDHYGDVLFALKEYDLAFLYWNQAKALDDTLGIEEKIKAKKAEIGR
ncbi:MAG: tetratricopeptide repeat protein [Bacteroidales bacterium]|nr:tetratricopeptide repeat protein [Bacteroidales bacterium]